MSEEEEIRQAVIELLAAQEAGEDISELLPQVDGANTPLSADEADVAEADTLDVDTPEARAAAIAHALDVARAYSQASRLLTPADWEACGIVPSFMTCEDLEMEVYDHLMEYQQACNLDQSLAPLEPSSSEDAAGEASSVSPDGAHNARRRVNPHTHSKYSSSPGRAVGMSGFKRRAKAPLEVAEEDIAPEPELEPASDTAVKPAPEPEPSPAPDPRESYPECIDIRLLMGANSYYLYDSRVMTDTYARWSYLAAENDPVAAFIECVRDESRTYPRPMAITNLANPPFLMDAEAVEAAFASALDQGRADDIERIQATNGDVYFYSKTYLTPTRAQSLAQYDAVERAFNV
ncbi:hypothetical protein [Adlercreutzia agrestimuris]|uniref:hypothetical protein n=1 Tax=Adlercreutzia agrestimuris TaxID=2941324 RepID=UPI00203DDEAD|nr:hypothetical protein [Adlercreutzia agrestimuris]